MVKKLPNRHNTYHPKTKGFQYTNMDDETKKKLQKGTVILHEDWSKTKVKPRSRPKRKR